MAVRKIRKTWRVDFWFDRIRYRKRSPENTRAGAKAYERTLLRRLGNGESLDKPDPKLVPTFKQFARRWFDEYVVTNNKYSEQRSKKYVLNSVLIPFFGKMHVAQIKSHDTERFKSQLKKKCVSNKTVKNYLTVLNKCLGTAYEWLELEGLPPKIKWPKCDPPSIRFLSPDECELLLQHADGIVGEMILMALRTGMRQGELKGLQWASIDWQNRSVTIRHSRDDREKILVSPKSNRERHIPLDIDVFEALHRRKRTTGYVFLDADEEPFDYHRMERRLTKVCKAAGIHKFGWHKLRHTFASQLATKGVPMTAIQQLMGHSNITTTMKYAHLAPSTLREAIDILNPKLAIKIDLGHPAVTEWRQSQRNGMVADVTVPKSPL